MLCSIKSYLEACKGQLTNCPWLETIVSDTTNAILCFYKAQRQQPTMSLLRKILCAGGSKSS